MPGTLILLLLAAAFVLYCCLALTDGDGEGYFLSHIKNEDMAIIAAFLITAETSLIFANLFFGGVGVSVVLVAAMIVVIRITRIRAAGRQW